MQQLIGIETHAQVLDAQGPAGVDEGGGRCGPPRRGASSWSRCRIAGPPAGSPVSREERPASQVRPMGLGIALEHLRRIPLRIHGDGDKKYLGPESVPRRACSPASFAVSSGQVSVQEAKMKVTATTLPRRSLRASRVRPPVVRLNAGAGPIFGRSTLSPTAWLSASASQLTTASTMRPPSRPSVPHVHAPPPVPKRSSPRPRCELSLPLHLLLQLVEEAPVVPWAMIF